MSELQYTQNFLHSPSLVAQIITAAAIPPGATVLEIGPGKGIITEALASQVTETGRVVGVELDALLASALKSRFEQVPQVTILQGNILEVDLAQFGPDYQVFSNVPFNITSALLERLFAEGTGPESAYLILQTDALISSGPYGDGETFKSLMIQPRYDVEVVHMFSPTDFVPRPSVATALFRFVRRVIPLITDAELTLYKDFLAFVSKDRAGEGAWTRVLPKPALQALSVDGGLVPGRGLKSQSVEALVAAFRAFQGSSRIRVVSGAMQDLRQEQARREQINRAGGHHRTRRARPRRR